MRRRPLLAALAFAAAVTLPACGSSATPAPFPALRSAPEPAVSPPAASNLPGTVVARPGEPEGIAVTASGVVAVNVRTPNLAGGGLVVFPMSTPAAATAAATIDLGGSARHLTLGGPDGPALVADESDDEFVRVELPGGQVQSRVKVGRQPHEAITVGPDAYFVFDELANTIHIVDGSRVVRVVAAPLQPGGGALSLDGRHVVAVGVRGRRITEYTTGGDVVGSANCGAGPTHVITGDGGLFWVNDTNGDEVLGFRLGAHGPVQVAAIPTGAGTKPYGIAYDRTRHTLWTTLTGTDQLLGLTFDGTKVTHRTTFATVQQPNTVAVDPSTGALVVTGSLPDPGGRLQFLP